MRLPSEKEIAVISTWRLALDHPCHFLTQSVAEYPAFQLLLDNQAVLHQWVLQACLGLHQLGETMSRVHTATQDQGSQGWKKYRRGWIKACRKKAQTELLERGFETLTNPKPKDWLDGLWRSGVLVPADGTPHICQVVVDVYLENASCCCSSVSVL